MHTSLIRMSGFQLAPRDERSRVVEVRLAEGEGAEVELEGDLALDLPGDPFHLGLAESSLVLGGHLRPHRQGGQLVACLGNRVWIMVVQLLPKFERPFCEANYTFDIGLDANMTSISNIK